MILKKLALAVAVSSAVIVSAHAADRDRHDDGRGNAHEYGASSFAFALIGDGPYGDAVEPAFDNMLTNINRDRTVEFVIHIGDVKSGGTECSDERLIRRFNQLQQLRIPLIYTPGDNEWTDCHRANNGGYYPLERLQFIRDLFFPNPNFSTGGHPMRVMTQANMAGYEQFVENTMFMRNRVMFVQTHVVGSANNLRPWSPYDPTDTAATPRADRLAEYTARNEANLVWLESAFATASSRGAAGLVVSMQADMALEFADGDPARLGFDDFLNKLFELTQTFGKPVLLAHGDSHLFRVD
ncbi:MAG: metallophosphoesterase, partial [Anaerolineae bacterium]|nr:metallophosphoesterase [Anaerolineae bacterium]